MYKKIKSLIKGHWKVLLVALFVLAKAVFYYNHYLGREIYFQSDSAIYAILASRFLEGDFLRAFHPYWNAGFPLAIIPFYLVTQSWESASIILSMVSHLALIVLMYFSLKSINSTLALVASFLVAFSQGIERFVISWGITEPFYILVAWLGIYFGYKVIQTDKLRYYILAGLTFGYAFLTRTEGGIIFATVTAVLIAVRFFEKRKKLSPVNRQGFILAGLAVASILTFRSTRGTFFALILGVIFLFNARYKLKQGIKKIALELLPKGCVLVFAFLLINVPYFAAISIQLGKPVTSGKYAYLNSGPPFKIEERTYSSYAQDVWSIDFPNYKSSYYENKGTSGRMWKNLDTIIDIGINNIKERIAYYAYGNLFDNTNALLALIGIVVGLFVFPALGVYLLIIWLASFLWVCFFMEAPFRYVAYSLPLFHVFQAFTVLSIGFMLSKINRKLLAVTVILFFALYLKFYIDPSSYSKVSVTRGSVDQKVIGEWLKNHNIKLVMGRTEAIGFYADAQMVYTPFADPDTVVKYSKAWGVEYILARPAEFSWVYMQEMALPSFKHPDLILEHEFDDVFDRPILWKVKLTEDEKQHNIRTGTNVYRDSTEVF